MVMTNDSDLSTNAASNAAPTADPPLSGRRIIVGVSGGIAAYKAPVLVRRLRDAGADIQVVTTANAERFVTATSLQAVSGRPVRNDLWDAHAEAAMGHIELARWAELILIAPASADLLARLAAGRADDLLTTLRLASRAPLLLAPAMNVAMWQHPATRRNVERLRTDGDSIVEPDSGPMACGEFGPGRMPEPEALVQHAARLLGGRLQEDAGSAAGTPLAGRHVVVTAGPTREAIDPVRYISNHSSGRQGYAVAAAARAAGARVTLISGPVTLDPPRDVTVVPVTSAADMHDAVMAHLGDCDVFVGVAAVADFRPATSARQKLKKSEGTAGDMTLELIENPDIIAAVAAAERRPFVVGFAAETHDALNYARDKRRRKNLDLIVANDVSDPGIGFNSADNAVTIIWDGGEETVQRSGKAEIASAIIATVARRLANS